MQTTGTHFNYFHICHRKLWLFANGINMEHESELVAMGKLIHETSYPQRPERFEEIELQGIKIDFYDPKNQVVHEIKKSDKREEAHIWQLKYYLYVLELNGINATGVLEYPKLRTTEKIELTQADKIVIVETINHIEQIIAAEACPAKLQKPKCKNCSYFDFCWSGEGDEWGEKIEIRDRLKLFALNMLKLSEMMPESTRGKVINYQLTKSGTSVYANFRAALRGRSKAEFYSKLSISVEEADETEMWIDLLISSGLQNNDFTKTLHKESLELLKILSSMRKKLSN